MPLRVLYSDDLIVQFQRLPIEESYRTVDGQSTLASLPSTFRLGPGLSVPGRVVVREPRSSLSLAIPEG
jgi:hypothetical protein